MSGNFRDGYLDRAAEFGKIYTEVLLTADNQVVTLGAGQGLLRLSSDNTTAANRTFTLSGGDTIGQELSIVFESGSSTTAQLASSGNAKLTGTWEPTQWNAIKLIWNGTYWIEDTRNSGITTPAAAVANLSAFSDLTVGTPAAAAQGASYSQSDLNTALDTKADQSDVETFVTALNADLSALYTKVNALLTSLRNASLIDT